MQQLSDDQLDALKELVNVGVGRAAGMLNEMIEFNISLQVPMVKLLTPKELQVELHDRLGQGQVSAVKLDFNGSFSGNAQLVFPVESAASLVSVLTGEAPNNPDLDALKIGTLTEIGNIVINGVMGSMSNMLSQPLNYSVPNYIEEDIECLISLEQNNSNNSSALLAQARFHIEELQVQGDIVLFLGVGSLDALLDAISLVG